MMITDLSSLGLETWQHLGGADTDLAGSVFFVMVFRQVVCGT